VERGEVIHEIKLETMRPEHVLCASLARSLYASATVARMGDVACGIRSMLSRPGQAQSAVANCYRFPSGWRRFRHRDDEEQGIISEHINSSHREAHWQCDSLHAGVVRFVGNVKAEFSAHGKHDGILRQHLPSHGLEVLML
jgi:hypothetical protein